MRLKIFTYIIILTLTTQTAEGVMFSQIAQRIKDFIKRNEEILTAKTEINRYPNLDKQVSSNFIEFIKHVEGVRNKPYKDVVGLWTIGVGHLVTKDELFSGKIFINGVPIRYKDGLTDQQVVDLLLQDVSQYEDSVRTNVLVPLDQHQYDALVSFTFNVGRHAFERSSLLKYINYGAIDKVPSELLRWTYAGGKRIKGLLNRRNKEINVFTRGDYAMNN